MHTSNLALRLKRQQDALSLDNWNPRKLANSNSIAIVSMTVAVLEGKQLSYSIRGITYVGKSVSHYTIGDFVI